MGAAILPAVVGATGYTGFELTRLLLSHPRSRKPLLLHDREDAGTADLVDSYPQLAGRSDGFAIDRLEWDGLKRAGVDVLFLCTPHDVSRRVAPEAVERGYRVVDLSGAWRLDGSAAYGIPELHARTIADARLVANAGCYATSIILALAAWIRAGMIDLEYGVVSDSKSGVSGAGREPTARTHFVEVCDNLSAYSVFGHRHTGEILEQLGLASHQLQFTPHVLPIPRGIMSTIYLRAAAGVTEGDLAGCLRDFHADHPFVRVFGPERLPEIKFSLHTNYCDVGFAMEPAGRRVVLVSCLDNLLKGAAGQGIQNMNVMFGWDQREGLQ